MKTTKVILVAILMAFASIGFTQIAENVQINQEAPTISAIISLESAMQSHGLILAMQTQLTKEFLNNDKPIYIVHVKYNKRIYHIYATYKSWVRFFGLH